MYQDLDPILHSQLRLAIMSFLIAQKESEFNQLKEITKATSGNLSVQLKKLEEVEYISIQKGYKENYPHTAVKITEKGIEAFETYVNVLKKYIG
jgi:DNA-binding HxlR family transcriptional regulator